MVSGLLRRLGALTQRPLVAYPNSGEVWDARQRCWLGTDAAADFATLCQEWYQLGARRGGGCCRTGPEEIRAIRRGLTSHRRPRS